MLRRITTRRALKIRSLRGSSPAANRSSLDLPASFPPAIAASTPPVPSDLVDLVTCSVIVLAIAGPRAVPRRVPSFVRRQRLLPPPLACISGRLGSWLIGRRRILQVVLVGP